MKAKMEEKVEAKQVSEREIWVGRNRVYLGEDNVVDITTVGEIDEKTAIAMKEALLKLMNMVEGKVHALTDLNKAGKTTPQARNIFRGLAEHEKAGKVAQVGMHPVARVLGSFVMGVSKKKDFRFFKTKEEAFKWLKE